MQIEELYLKLEELTVRIRVINSRTMFGQNHCEVTPIEGFGSKWVRKENILKPADAKVIAKIK